MRASPVVESMSMLNKPKRKRTSSPDPCSPPRDQPVKKHRSEGGSIQQELPGMPRTAPKADLQQAQILRQSSCASPRSTDKQQKGAGSNEGEMRARPRTDSLTDHVMQVDSEAGEARRRPAVAVKLEGASTNDDPALKAAEAVSDLSPLQQVIENEFNMQILVKHNELRLIEQELAKCQIALEQLRRCQLRPFPGVENPASSISAGTGPAIAPSPGNTQPSHSAPYGVTDGPYTRHYQRWLLPDAQFDSMPDHFLSPAESGPHTGVRSTRGHGTARKSVSKPISVPGRTSDALHSLPNYPMPAAPKDKSSPLVLRRSTDGQLVKLICNNCLRGNFSSIQGFLNHCRIAHKVDYKSHDAAAVDCGRVLEEHEMASLPPETHAMPAAPKLSGSRSSSTVNTPFKTSSHVHPMNQSGATAVSAPHAHQGKAVNALKPVPVPSWARPVHNAEGAQFTPSSQAPRLSAQFAKYQLGGNLEQAITNAKQKVDIGADEEMASPDAPDSASPISLAPGSRTIPGASRAGSLAPPGNTTRPPSRKGYWEAVQRHGLSPLHPAPAPDLSVPLHGHAQIPESPSELSPNLSPHTADNNPGLVSDHEDDDHGSASEDDVPHAPAAHSLLAVRRGGCADRVHGMDLDVAVDDDISGEHGVVIRRNSMLAADDNSPGAASSASRKLGKDA